ncbi:MAG: folate-binding protein YgfZ [Rhizobiales bacterium]|nr:folate-binding protein YgfZ [Hyphomicrobiales bacterium]
MAPLILTDRAVISVRGADAPAFLQSLLSADCEALISGDACPAALLTPQGKILFDMIVFRDESGFLVDCRSQFVDALAKRLSFYRLRSKVEICLQESFQVVWLPPPVAPAGEFSDDPRSAELGSRGLSNNCSGKDGSSAYHQLRVALGIAEAGLDYDPDAVFAHEANLDILSGVSFSKGCFIGQEVVSRMHHRGTVRKRFLPCEVEGDIPQTGTPVNVGERTIGTIGSSAGRQVLSLLRLDHLEAALSSKTPILAGGAILTPRIPDWLRGEIPNLLRQSA